MKKCNFNSTKEEETNLNTWRTGNKSQYTKSRKQERRRTRTLKEKSRLILTLHFISLTQLVAWSQDAQGNIFGILLNHTKIRLYLPCTNWFGTANGRCPFAAPNQWKCMVNTIWFGFDLIKFRKYFSVYSVRSQRVQTRAPEPQCHLKHIFLIPILFEMPIQ